MYNWAANMLTKGLPVLFELKLFLVVVTVVFVVLFLSFLNVTSNLGFMFTVNNYIMGFKANVSSRHHSGR